MLPIYKRKSNNITYYWTIETKQYSDNSEIRKFFKIIFQAKTNNRLQKCKHRLIVRQLFYQLVGMWS